MKTLLVVLVVLAVPCLASAEETAVARAREHVLAPIVVRPRAPTHVFVARSRTERPLEELRANFTDEIVATASAAPF